MFELIVSCVDLCACLCISLPMDVRLAKMLVYASIFHCVTPIATLCALLSDRSPFLCPFEKCV